MLKYLGWNFMKPTICFQIIIKISINLFINMYLKLEGLKADKDATVLTVANLGGGDTCDS